MLFDGVDIQEDLIAYKAQVGYVPEEAHVYTYLTGPEYLRLVGRLRGIPAERARRRRSIASWRSSGSTPTTTRRSPRSRRACGRRSCCPPRCCTTRGSSCSTSRRPASTSRPRSSCARSCKTLAAEQRIIFYSSHELETIEKISTRVIILRSGRIVADDSAARLRELMHLPSLEDVFAQLAVKDNLDQIADGLMAAIQTVRIDNGTDSRLTRCTSACPRLADVRREIIACERCSRLRAVLQAHRP